MTQYRVTMASGRQYLFETEEDMLSEVQALFAVKLFIPVEHTWRDRQVIFVRTSLIESVEYFYDEEA